VHRTGDLASVVCSNSLRSDKLGQRGGLLKEEMRRWARSSCASPTRCGSAGAALAVDRERFARRITEEIAAHPLISVARGEVVALPEDATPDRRRLSPPDR